MKSSEIRSRFLEFFKERKHEIIESASLVTADEKGVTDATLFNAAGMQPLIPYLLGKPYVTLDGREAKRLANVQKCLRTIDIGDVGDNTHATFFEMLGNWSLGDYFKKEAINWSYEFLTNPADAPEGQRGLGLDPKRLYVTVFEGDENAPRDDEAARIWGEIFNRGGINKEGTGDDAKGAKRSRVFFMPASSNWWEAGENGPCGPDTEMYYDIGDPKTGKPFFEGKPITKERFIDADAKKQIVEVWNDVFMQYEKKDGKVVGKLAKPSVDTGAGLERLAMVMQGVDNIYDTDLLKPAMDEIKKHSKNWDIISARIVADHMRASVFLIADGVAPSNTDRGYVLRKLLRRSVRHADSLKTDRDLVSLGIVDSFIDAYKDIYSSLERKEEAIKIIISAEEAKFRETLRLGLKEFEKGADAFMLFSSYGFPLELTLELAKEKGIKIDTKDFEEKFKKHQELSRAGAEKKFKGGLADGNDPMVVRYHTATHLLHQALHDTLGEEVAQKGSNITAERLRFDFAHGAKMTDEQKKKVEEIVNRKIDEALPVSQVLMSKTEAERTGARHFFGEKYGDKVSIYYIGRVSDPPSADDLKNAYSKEFCGGPHVKNTRELAGTDGKARFKIVKEEAVAQGVRRIKAVLKNP